VHSETGFGQRPAKLGRVPIAGKKSRDNECRRSDPRAARLLVAERAREVTQQGS
jgi:hypothetical protein